MPIMLAAHCAIDPFTIKQERLTGGGCWIQTDDLPVPSQQLLPSGHHDSCDYIDVVILDVMFLTGLRIVTADYWQDLLSRSTSAPLTRSQSQTNSQPSTTASSVKLGEDVILKLKVGVVYVSTHACTGCMYKHPCVFSLSGINSC